MMDDSHSGDAIANHILEVVNDFNIADKILSVTLDLMGCKQPWKE